MKIDWPTVGQAAWSVVLILVGAVVTTVVALLFERKPNLTYYASHWSAYPRPGLPPVTIHTHGILLKNIGRKTATDVRVRHELRTETFYVTPRVQHTDPDTPGGGFEIVFPRLVPQEEVAISYMHTQPFNNFRGQITHAAGLAAEVPAIPRAEHPKWMTRAILFLAIVGAIAGAIAVVFVGLVLGRRVMPW